MAHYRPEIVVLLIQPPIISKFEHCKYENSKFPGKEGALENKYTKRTTYNNNNDILVLYFRLIFYLYILARV